MKSSLGSPSSSSAPALVPAAGLPELLRELVAIPSVSGEEGAIADFVARRKS